MQDSIFTKIIKGEIPSHKVHEDEHTFAFLDIHPSVPGHTLVVPKKQVEFVWDMDDKDYQHLMASVKEVAQHLRESLGVPYVGVRVEGVDVPHAHVHLVPFSTAAEYRNVGDPNADPDHEQLSKVAEIVAF